MKVVILWLLNEKDEILLAQRAARMSTDAGMWGPSVSGKIDEGETAEQAAIREADEELGIAISAPLHFLHESTHEHSDGRLREFTFFYTRVKSSLTQSMQFAPNEVAAVKWVSLAQFRQIYLQEPETIIISTNERLWQEIFENLESALDEN